MASDARFLAVFRAYVAQAEWVTARQLACRLMAEESRGNPMWLSAMTRSVSRKLSNLNRFGHLDRRPAATSRDLEYSLANLAARDCSEP